MIGSAALRQLRPRLQRSFSQAVADQSAWNQAPVVVTTLSNGVRVATQHRFGEAASVGVFLDAGVRSETGANIGATHLLEQLARSGTKKRPKDQFEKEIASMGASLNIDSGREQTAYTMNVMKGDVKQGVDILADLVTAPGVGNLKKEVDGFARNLEELSAPTRAVIDDRLHACAFRDGPLGNSSIGPFEGIQAMAEGTLSQFVADNYTADRMVLTAAGDVKHEDLVALAEAKLGGVKAGTPAAGIQKPYFCGADLLYRNDEMGATAYVSVAFEGVPHRSGDAVTFMVMQHCIGEHFQKGTGLVPGSISGNRTINNISNKMGVGCADSYETFSLNYKDTGLFGFFAACDEVAVEHCIGELMFSINLLSFSITEEEVARAKRELKASICSDSSAAHACTTIGQQVLNYGRHVSLAEMMIRIDAVDSEEIKRVAWKYLNDNNVAATALGPIHGMPQYLDLQRMTTMHRY